MYTPFCPKNPFLGSYHHTFISKLIQKYLFWWIGFLDLDSRPNLFFQVQEESQIFGDFFTFSQSELSLILKS